MGTELTATVGTAALLTATLRAGDVGKFPRATVRDSAGALVTTVDLTYVAGSTSLYEGTWTPSVAGPFTAEYVVYTDSGHTAADPTYWPATDNISVDGTVGVAKLVSALATDSVNAAALAASAVTEIQAGLATAATQATHTAALAAIQADTDALQADSATVQAALAALADQVALILGLAGNNVFIDNTDHDLNNQLTSCRIRIFGSAAEAQAATDNGSEPALLTLNVETTYEALGRMGTHRSVGP